MQPAPQPSRLRALTGFLFVATCAALVAPPAHARPFKDGDLMAGRAMKPSSDDRIFSAGANFQIAPVKAIVQSVVKDAVDTKIKGTPAEPIIEYIQYLDTDQVRALADSGQIAEFRQLIKQQAAEHGQPLTPAQEAALDQVDAATLRNLADVVDIYNSPKETMTFSLEPYVTLNLAPVRLKAQIAIAGFNNDDKTSLELGNLGLDASTGYAFGASGAAVGVTAGGSLWLPTGTADANVIALTNVLATPRYMHGYTSATGYGLVAAELAMFDVTLRGEFVHMEPSSRVGKDDELMRRLDANFVDRKAIRYAQLGFGVLADLGLVGLSAEVDGLVGIENAAGLDKVWLGTIGARLFLGPAQVGAGLQVPLVQGEQGSLGGARLGSMADFNFLLTGQFKL